MDDHTEVPVTEDDRQKLRNGLRASEAQRQRVADDLDASLEEPTVFSKHPEDEDETKAREDGRPPCDFCGKYAHSFEDCPAALEVEEGLEASATVGQEYVNRQNKHAALDMAIRVVTSPYSPFRTERASADEIVAYAEKFRDFLDG